jgi:GAF domain-containing protein
MASAKATQTHGRGSKDAQLLDELARLRTEHDRLSEQVKRLVKTESELYVIQEQLDGQIRIYRRLYEIGKEFNATFELAKVLEVTAHFALYELNFERCLVLLRPIESTTFSVEMADGYYDESSIRSVESLVLPIEAPALAPLLAGAEELLCPQSSNQEHLLRLGQALGMQEYVVFPLGSDGTYPVGLLAAGNTEERAPYQSRVRAETDEMLGLANLASQATTAINKAKFYLALTAERQLLEAKVEDRTRELARSVEELRALGEVGQAVSSTLDLDRVLATVAARAVELSGTDSGVIYEYDPSTESFRVRATHRVDPALNSALQGEPLRIGEGAIGRAALDRV